MLAYVNFYLQVPFSPLKCTTLYYDLISQVLRNKSYKHFWTYLDFFIRSTIQVMLLLFRISNTNRQGVGLQTYALLFKRRIVLR